MLSRDQSSAAETETSQRFADARDVDELARRAVALLCATFRCDAAVLICRAQSGEAIFWASSPSVLPEMSIPGLPARINEGTLAERALKTGKTVSITEPGTGLGGRATQHTVIAVPLKTESAVLGVIQLSGDSLDASASSTTSALEFLAQQIAAAVAKLQTISAANRSATKQVSPAATREAQAQLNLEKVYDSTFRVVGRLMPCDAFFIMLFDQENKSGEFVFRVDNGVRLPTERVPLEQGLVDYVLRNKCAVVVVDVDQETRFKIRRWGKPPSVRSLVCVPIEHERKMIGALSAQSYELSAYSEGDAQTLSIFSDQAALALHNARLFVESQRKVDQLAVLNEVTRIVSSTIEISQLLELIYGEVRRILPTDSYYVALIDEENQALTVEVMVDEGERFPPTVIPMGENLVSVVVRQQAPLLLKNVQEESPRLGIEPHQLGKPRISKSWLGVPLITSEHLLGVLAVSSYQLAAFDESDQEMLQNIAMQAAVAIDNARHHAEVEWQAQHDSLTVALTHGYFLTRLREEIERAEATGALLSLIMLDIDHFKEYNDSFGHLSGDTILRGTVQAILGNIKSRDLVGRWGGEEFVIALPGCGREEAHQVAERVRITLKQMQLQNEQGKPVPVPTVSQGIATFPEDVHDPIALVDVADARLYKAKERGRDQISVAEEEERESGSAP